MRWLVSLAALGVLALGLWTAAIARAGDEAPSPVDGARDGLRTAAAEPGTVRLLDRLRLDAGTERVRALAWSPTGRALAAGCSDRRLRVWQTLIAAPSITREIPRYG